LFWNVLYNNLYNYYNNNLKRVPVESHFLLFIDYYYRHVLVKYYYYYYYHYWTVIYSTRNKALFQYNGCELKLSAFKFKSTINENLLHLYNIMDNKFKKKTLITLSFVEWQCAVYINYILIMHCNNRRFMYLCVKSWISNPRLKYLVYKILLKKKTNIKSHQAQ